MLIGVLGLGMFLGTLTGAIALIAGQSFLTALSLYALVGTLSALTIALVLYAISELPRCSDETASGRSVQ